MKPSSRGLLFGLLNALVSASISGVISWQVSDYLNQSAQDRTLRIERLLQFSTTTDALVESANAFIAAMARQEDLAGVQSTLRTEIGKQMQAAEDLKLFFGPDAVAPVQQYQSALQEFAELVQATDSPAGMSEWVRTYDAVLNQRLALTKTLRLTAGS